MIDINTKTCRQLTWLRLAGIGGLVLTLVDTVTDYLFRASGSVSLLVLNILLATIGTLLVSLFIYAFVILGNLYKKQLATLAWLQIILGVFVTVIGNLGLYGGREFAFVSVFVLGGAALKGVLMILFGFQIKPMVGQLGSLAKPVGQLNIIAGVLFVSVILAPIAIFFDLITTLYSIALLNRLALGQAPSQVK